MVLGVEEVGGPKVRVAVGLAGVDAGAVDARLDLGVPQVLVGCDLSGQLAEASAHRRNHEVLDGEFHVRMGGVDGPEGLLFRNGGYGHDALLANAQQITFL